MKRRVVIRLIVLFTLVFSSFPAFGAVREYHLTIEQQDVTIRDKTAAGMTINGSIPGPTLYFQEGDLARIHVTNEMSVATSVHWHGLLVPPSMDGVPYVTQAPIQPGTTFTYEFPIRQTGTYWYHSHSGLQEQSGLYGSIVIADSAHQADRDYVLLLSDWTADSPKSVLRTLKRGSEWYSLDKGSAQSALGAAKADRFGDYFTRELQRMPPMDIADVAYDFFLSNGKPETSFEAQQGETIRLRVINGSATTYFHLNFAGGPMTIVSADGQLVQPIDKEIFLMGVAETYDVIITLPGNGTYEFRATAHDGSGFTSAWIGAGEKHPARTVPKPDLYVPMDHGDMHTDVFALTPQGTMGMPDALVEEGAFDQPTMGHTGHHGMGHPPANEMGSHTKHEAAQDMPMADTQHSHDAKQMDPIAQNESPHMQPARPMDMKGMDAEPQKMETMPATHQDEHVELAHGYGNKFGFLATDIASRKNRATEGGPERPGTPYMLLKAQRPTKLPKDAPLREVRLTLDGDMQRYTWFLNNKPLSESDSILIKEGEVVRFIMINRTMMHHPMHLHGHFFRVINGQGDYSPLKHTVDVAPMSTTVIEFYGNEVGDWLFHCHLLYHMKSGMTRLVHYDGFEPEAEVSDIRGRLYKDPLYFYGSADILSNMTEGALTLTNSRYSFEADWEVGWQGVEETEWESLISASYHIDRFTSLFVGVDILGEGSSSDETRGVAGLRYLLPLNIESAAWLDTDGGARFMLEKEIELTPRLGLHGDVEYDTHEQWEGKVGLSYMLSKDFSVLANWHSEYGLGAGLQVRF